MCLLVLIIGPFWPNNEYGPITRPQCIFFLFFYNEPELGVGIDPGMALTPLSSSIGQGLNPQPSDYEPSALPLDHGFRLLNILSSVMK